MWSHCRSSLGLKVVTVSSGSCTLWPYLHTSLLNSSKKIIWVTLQQKWPSLLFLSWFSRLLLAAGIWCHMEICFLAVRIRTCGVVQNSLFLIKGTQKSKNKSPALSSSRFQQTSEDSCQVACSGDGSEAQVFTGQSRKAEAHAYRTGMEVRGRSRTH